MIGAIVALALLLVIAVAAEKVHHLTRNQVELDGAKMHDWLEHVSEGPYED